MKKKHILIAVVTCFTLFGVIFSTLPTSKVLAEENSLLQTEKYEHKLDVDLNMEVGESKAQNFIDSNGEKYTLKVTKIESLGTTGFRSWGQVYAEKASNGVYHVNYIRGLVNCGFYISIYQRNITSAYDLWYFNLPASSANLVHESNKQATAYFDFQASFPFVGGPSWNGALRARIDADHLVTYVR